MSLQAPVAFLGGSLGAGEVLLILVVALVLFGSKNLPRIARNLGRAMEEVRRAARQFSDEILRAGDQPRSKPGKLPPAKTEEPKDSKDEPAG